MPALQLNWFIETVTIYNCHSTAKPKLIVVRCAMSFIAPNSHHRVVRKLIVFIQNAYNSSLLEATHRSFVMRHDPNECSSNAHFVAVLFSLLPSTVIIVIIVVRVVKQNHFEFLCLSQKGNSLCC